MTNLAEEIARFELATARMKTLLSTIDTDLFHKKPSAEEWSVAQIASHVDEAISYWLEDIRALQIVPNAKWGRNHEHVRRLAAVADVVTEKLTPQDAIKKINHVEKEVSQVFSTITTEQLEQTAPSYNPNFDGKKLAFIVDHLIVVHAEGHAGQMERHLKKVTDTSK